MFASLSPNTRGILCLLVAMCFLIVSDSVIKWLSTSMALHEITLLRGLLSVPFLAVFIYFEGGIKTLKSRHPIKHTIRVIMIILANIFFFLGLAAMPLAETIAIFYITPMLICLMSGLFLGEQVGWFRWVIIVTGLMGVLIILRPGTDLFRVVSVLPILAAASYAVCQILTRNIGISEKAGAMTLYIQVGFILISILSGLLIGDGRFDQFENESLSFLFRAWVWPDADQYALLLLCGTAISVGGYLLSQAYRIAQASAVAPFEYSSMPLALVLGLYLWGDWPDSLSMLGSAIIIGSGLLMVTVENRQKSRATNVA